MKNQELVKIFSEIADYLEMEKIVFKPYAYRKAAANLELLENDVQKIYQEGGIRALEKIIGIGKSIAQKIEEYLKTGEIKYYRQFKEKFPLNLSELVQIQGMGPKKAKLLYQELKIKNLKDLERAAINHKIAGLFGFGEKTEKNILEGIVFLKKSRGRFLLGEILPRLKEILKKLKKLKEVEQINAAGSVRRMKETVRDVDLLITVKNEDSAGKIMDFFVQLPGVVKIWMKGQTKASVRMREGFDIDLRVVKNKSYGSALQYFTGSKEHNIALRRIAMEKGLKLSEYGLFRNKKMIAGWKESGIYNALGLPWIEPELRENKGEIEAALQSPDILPRLLKYGDIKGDLHCHSHWGVGMGRQAIKELIKFSLKMGYQYIGISDHTKFLAIEHGLNEKQLTEQGKYIDKLNQEFGSKFKILKGCEANILKDGSIDIKDESLKKLDYVIAGIHSSFKTPKEKMTKRIIKAMNNPNVDIISHPFGRIIQRREAYEIDFKEILKTAKKTGTILEINANPLRLDLSDIYIRRAKQAGVKMIIGADSHRKEQMKFMEFGISQARRGWAEKKEIANAWPLRKLIRFFKA
jgi:DNA polymerase (family X)